MAGGIAFMWVFMQTELHTEQYWSCALSLHMAICQGTPVLSILLLVDFQHPSSPAGDNKAYHG